MEKNELLTTSKILIPNKFYLKIESEIHNVTSNCGNNFCNEYIFIFMQFNIKDHFSIANMNYIQCYNKILHYTRCLT